MASFALLKKIALLWLTLLLLLGGAFAYGFYLKEQQLIRQKHNRKLASRFLLTDFCLSTESRHLRHRNTWEPIAPFQDFPAYHEHFPASPFFPPPVQEPEL